VGEQRTLKIGSITLNWCTWVPWPDVLIANRGGAGVHIPNRRSGVYEVRYADHSGDERLYIGETSNLRYCIPQGLVTGRARHSADRRIRGKETSQSSQSGGQKRTDPHALPTLIQVGLPLGGSRWF
jgi:hypothetical protein